MQFYNTLTRKKELFEPREPGKVGMYVCGITAYDYCHIGHARSAVFFDVLYRFFSYLGYQVTYVRNFTDVDDKIINKAKQENMDPDHVAQKFIQAFYQDMDKLGVLRPEIEPKATEHIKDMQSLVQKLLEKGYAYITPSGDVYFKVRAFDDYGRLSGRDIEELQSGIRIDPGEEKKDPLDFALWKKAKDQEPSWPSPWGPGRPGWHVECSAMSERYLGLPLDIHGGGQDLTFPHHENERAQSMASSGKNFANYWLHNGFIQIKNEKMSKSLGNFIILREIYEDYLPETLRFFLLSKHYRSPLDFSWEALQESEKGLKRFYQTKFLILKARQRKKWKKTSIPEEIKKEIEVNTEAWKKSLEDDLNTAAALGYVFNLVRLTNRLLEDKDWRQSQEAKEIFDGLLKCFQDISRVLGIFEQDPGEFLNQLKEYKAKRKNLDLNQIEDMVDKRNQARKRKDFAQADQIRDQLLEMEVEIQDTPEGTVWDVE